MQLNLETDYAIRCLLYLAGQEKFTSSAQVGKAIALTPNHAQKILHRLRKAGFVSVARGSEGGYTLAQAPDRVHVLDVIEKMEGTIAINRCLEPDGYCSMNATEKCPMHKFYLHMQQLLQDKFGKTTLQDVIDRKFDN